MQSDNCFPDIEGTQSKGILRSLGISFVVNKTVVRAHLQGMDLANWPWGPRSSGISHVPGHWPLLETSRLSGSFPPLSEIRKKSNPSALEGRVRRRSAPSASFARKRFSFQSRTCKRRWKEQKKGVKRDVNREVEKLLLMIPIEIRIL